MAAVRVRTVQVELPEEAFSSTPWAPAEIAGELRAIFLVEQVRERRLGHGKAAELAGMSLMSFVRLMGRHGVSPFDHDPGELAAEVEGPL